MPTLLVTGAAGIVGTALRPYLRERFNLRLLDRRPVSELAANETALVGDLTDPAFVRQACEGVDAVLHLACAHGTDIQFQATVEPNYHATLYLLEAAQRAGARRFVFASSHHVLGQYHTQAAEQFDDHPVAPDSYYALSKVFGEAACATFSQRSELATFIVRIGNADAKVADARRLRLWTSARDLAQLVLIGLEHPEVRHEIVYGVSECPQALFHNSRARALGYRPQDNAAEHLADNFLTYDAMAPVGSGRDHVGGAYAGVALASVLEQA
ncbi:NAD(P)-dependent oxidoreductase [Pseudomonas sp. BT-42-2]|jgi:uronate dehydrogenase|uniref:NAD-dependent epimerase/dehydratase family protein n=1 Tax=Pseudomonas sp. BT-42-2 TaxID=2986927 RepID=UPI0021F797BA|nr:NAD(P)-dependent oxidoreductase [Pseudomonas sp. BT-42-2]MCV9917487.1 NAD(P)-dependent oxidoreductase [Pseudomonas sp. BT-42-2]